MMRRHLDTIRLAVKRAPANAHDALFALACALLLPLSTHCKVCNMLRGMAIGAAVGAAIATVLTCYLGGLF
jgi:hypothetical protein